MTTQLTLTEEEIRIAICFWLLNSENRDADPKGVSFSVDLGDPPLSGHSVYATVQVKA